MGALCSKKSIVGEPKARKAAVEVTDIPSDPKSAQPPRIAASTVCPSTKPTGKEFVTGDGDGVYLMLAGKGAAASLVQQYAHSKPEVGDSETLLLQLKPPVYVEIKESRFLLQNGKRVLKTGITLAMNTAEGQKKLCEAVMECLRLVSVYSAYIHTYPEMVQAPFSVVLVVVERHKPATIKEDAKGLKFVPQVTSGTDVSNTEENKEQAEEKADAAGKAATEAEAAKKEAESDKKALDEQTKEAKKTEPLTIFQDSPGSLADAPPPEVLEQVVVLRHLPEGRSPNFSSLQFIIVVPQSKAQAEESFKEGRVLGESDIEMLEKQVDALNGVMASTAAVKDS